jgi:hypothetical protein
MDERVLIGLSLDRLEIDFKEQKWQSILPNNLGSFYVKELKRPCLAFPNGIFPGCNDYSSTEQICEVKNFNNYINFSQVVEDELIEINGNKYLTTKFYRRRARGWKRRKEKIKNGNIRAINVNGSLFNVHDKEQVTIVMYKNIYLNMVSGHPSYLELKSYIENGKSLVLKGYNSHFFCYLGFLLLVNSENFVCDI